MVVLRCAIVAIAGLLLAAAHPPPPPTLEPYIKDGEFDHGDYRWMRGAFEDASEQEKAEYQAIEAWTDACLATGKAEIVEALRALGYPNAQPDTMFAGPLVCMQVAMRPTLIDPTRPR